MADFITAGTLSAIVIQSLDGKSKWNLSTGKMDLYNTRITTSSTGNTYTTADYSKDDVERIRQIIFGNIVPTLADYEKLDLNCNGRFDAGDAVIINSALAGTREINFTSKWALKLDPADGEQLLKIYREYDDHANNTTREYVVFSAGFPRVQVNTVKGDNGDFDTLKVSGNELERKLLGYVVTAKGSSDNQATCFIPAEAESGYYQCASDDWFCAFHFSPATGEATQSGGTGTIVSTTPIYNF